MKTLILVSALFLVVTLTGYSQAKVLVIKNKTTGKELVLSEGNRIKVSFKNGVIYRGKIKFVIDSSIVNSSTTIMIGEKSININDIKKIKKQALFARFLGGTMIGGGSGISLFGLTGSIIAETEMAAPVGLAAAGVGMIIVTGGILITTIGKSYSYENYEFLIVQKSKPSSVKVNNMNKN